MGLELFSLKGRMALVIGSSQRIDKAVARGMIARQRGKIINICSVQSETARIGLEPRPGRTR